MEIYKRRRPQTFDAVLGQEEAVASLGGMLANGGLPHALMLSGPSGCGKTTLARILASALGCGEADLTEINAASSRGIDTVRQIESVMRLAPLGGRCRVWILDEAHQLTRKAGGDAQTALLKVLEDPPGHAYFFLCTTHPDELLPTVRTRCTEIRVRPLPAAVLAELVAAAGAAEGFEVSEALAAKVAEAAAGSARKALVILEQVKDIPGEDARLDAVSGADAKTLTVELCRALMFARKPWPYFCKLIGSLDKSEQPEDIRRAVLGYATKVALDPTQERLLPRALKVIDAFAANWYDCGRAGLVAACVDVLHG